MFQNQILKGPQAASPCHLAPGPGPEGPGALRSQYLWGNSELLGSNLNVFYVELASCRGVSEGICSSNILQLQGRAKFVKWHLEIQ